MLKRIFRALLIGFCLFPGIAQSQDLDSLLNLNAFTAESELQKMLNKNVAVSTQNLSTRETPGIISVVTAEEIQNSGARDLIDVLRMVPGFDVMQDLQFVVGIGLRGNWANEGKVLVLLDGQPMNELLYQTVALGNRFPVDAIERIEIIRGPGSAIYGGSAEYGVINMVTKAASSLNGVAVYGTGGFHADATGRLNGGVMAAQKGESVSWDLSFFKGRGIVSDQPYQDLYQDDDVQDLAKVTRADPMNINAGLKIKEFQLRTMYDVYETSDPFTFISSKNFFADAQYLWKINEKLSVTPHLRYTNQVPWAFGNRETNEYDLQVRATRMQGGATANYIFSRKVSVTAGALYFADNATDLLESQYFDGSDTFSMYNFAVFGQGLIKHRLANATIGFRYERNNLYGDAFVPRLALTKKIENFHFKVLYSQSFRAPSIENVNLSKDGDIKPEKSDVFELELGYQFTPQMLLAVNAFSLETRDVIIYSAEVIDNNNTLEGYENFNRSGTRGIEVVYSIRQKNWYANLSYSFSQAINSNTVDSYQVPQTTRQFVGALANKITLNTNFHLTNKLTFNPTFIYGGKRYAFTTTTDDADADGFPDIDDEGEPVFTPVANKLDPFILANAFLNYRNIVPGLTIGVGVFDLFNQRPAIPQAYNGDFAPIPGRSRELVIKLSYQLNFKK